jgi:hypothetical protein
MENPRMVYAATREVGRSTAGGQESEIRDIDPNNNEKRTPCLDNTRLDGILAGCIP